MASAISKGSQAKSKKKPFRVGIDMNQEHFAHPGSCSTVESSSKQNALSSSYSTTTTTDVVLIHLKALTLHIIFNFCSEEHEMAFKI